MGQSYSGNVNGTLTSPSSSNVLCPSGTNFQHYTGAHATGLYQDRWTNASYCPIVDWTSINSVIRSPSLRTANENHTNEELFYRHKQVVLWTDQNMMSDLKLETRKDYLRLNPEDYRWMENISVPIERFGSCSENHTNEELFYRHKQVVLWSDQNMMSDLKLETRKDYLRLNPEDYRWMENISVPIERFGSCSGNCTSIELCYIQEQRSRLLSSSKQLRRKGFWRLKPEHYTSDEPCYIQEQQTIIDINMLPSCKQLRIDGVLSLTPDHHQRTKIPSTPHRLLRGCVFGTARGFVEEVSGKFCKQSKHGKSSVEVGARSSEGNYTSIELLRLTPDHHQQTELPSTPRRLLRGGSVEEVSGKFCKQSKHGKSSVEVGARSSEDSSANILQQVEQITPDQFRRNVERFSHMIQRREYFFLSYDHHLLVLEFDDEAINVTEYGLPSGLINIIGAALENSLGQIHYKTITFNELFHPGASRVFFVYNEYHPNTTEHINALLERLRYREREKSYSLMYNNCEHYVNYLLTGNPISIQWRDASTAARFTGDALQKIPRVAMNGAVKLVLQNFLNKAQSKQVSVDRSHPEGEECEGSINAPAAQNTLGSKLRGIIKKRISSIHGRDLLFAMICSLLMIVIICVQGGHSPGGYIWEFIKIVGTETFLLLIRINRQLFEIVEILPLWLNNVISTGDLLREMFKSGVVYLICMTTVAVIFLRSNSTFSELFRLCLVIMVSSAFAGLLFDTGHFIINTIFRLL